MYHNLLNWPSVDREVVPNFFFLVNQQNNGFFPLDLSGVPLWGWDPGLVTDALYPQLSAQDVACAQEK